jgi:hypothetical protein
MPQVVSGTNCPGLLQCQGHGLMIAVAAELHICYHHNLSSIDFAFTKPTSLA